MPSVEIDIDYQHFRIDTHDYDMIGKWFADLLAIHAMSFNTATRIRLQITPMLVPDPHKSYWDPNSAIGDWNMDARKFRVWALSDIASPVDGVRKLRDTLTGYLTELGYVEPADATPEDARPL
jgi:hypothetical protein